MVLSGCLWDPFEPKCLGKSWGEQQIPTLDPQNLSNPGRRGSVTEHLQDGQHPGIPGLKPHQLHIAPREHMVRLTGSCWGREACACLFTSDSPAAAGYSWKCSLILLTSSMCHSKSPLTNLSGSPAIKRLKTFPKHSPAPRKRFFPTVLTPISHPLCPLPYILALLAATFSTQFPEIRLGPSHPAREALRMAGCEEDGFTEPWVPVVLTHSPTASGSKSWFLSSLGDCFPVASSITAPSRGPDPNPEGRPSLP